MITQLVAKNWCDPNSPLSPCTCLLSDSTRAIAFDNFRAVALIENLVFQNGFAQVVIRLLHFGSYTQRQVYLSYY